VNIVTKGGTDGYVVNLSNEIDFTYYTMLIESPEYQFSFVLTPPADPNLRSVTFSLTEGSDYTLPNNGDYPYSIINTSIEGSTTGNVVFRGIIRLKEAAEVVYSYDGADTTIVYE
jgi:hypothetical protein